MLLQLLDFQKTLVDGGIIVESISSLIYTEKYFPANIKMYKMSAVLLVFDRKHPIANLSETFKSTLFCDRISAARESFPHTFVVNTGDRYPVFVLHSSRSSPELEASR